jgi:large subunit ribosomal protein L21
VAKKEVSKPAVKAAPSKVEESIDLSSMTVAKLKELAKAKGLAGISAMKKADLISALS